jgi:hypothetical protein
VVQALSEPTSEVARPTFFIGGAWTAPEKAETHLAKEAATGRRLGTAAMASEADIYKAVSAATGDRCGSLVGVLASGAC